MKRTFGFPFDALSEGARSAAREFAVATKSTTESTAILAIMLLASGTDILLRGQSVGVFGSGVSAPTSFNLSPREVGKFAIIERISKSRIWNLVSKA
jgi:hypothetical protein